MDPTLDDLLHLQSSLQSPSFPDSDLSVSLPSFDTPESSSDRLHSILKSSTPPPNSSPGTGSLPGDCGFDPLNLYKIDFFSRRVMVDGERKKVERRPEYLIMRDYRAAEVRHGRLAMLTSILWPLQELLNKAFLPEDYTFSIVGGGVTLPWVTLGMVGGMMGLGYADVFAGVVQSEMTGEAYLGGDCFWDPLKILQGSTIEEERKMAAREVWNGRFAMMAVLFYAVQEGYTGKAVVDLEWNELFFYPIFAAKDIVPFL
ncbi:hypothetical protein TrVE_jg1574 [Triparma verrucosa]|nr:hypothetical protein TrVE_jg1574 [Triparma verrucosa]